MVPPVSKLKATSKPPQVLPPTVNKLTRVTPVTRLVLWVGMEVPPPAVLTHMLRKCFDKRKGVFKLTPDSYYASMGQQAPAAAV